ncbi:MULTISPECIES: class I SAM-dependent methyltransferase [Legionella]|uniref:Methyltransferase domain-containing protein n=1 Tax=Legionella resiliens TaxID=2905958 RepID=A0ABS8X1B3_9GAMM|nr:MULTISPECIES: class I SAM-dependent methyltransferase [unclassified Legionella]MCE0723365.1 methyltransferase domain-containing protein [Legionella sp. 9fVS26]MCE3532518.1 methyltransferase domain-containing protein [Legionella sp. 8cVS16]QLZ68650.1 Ubiquinone biosynthesis O-methyltransferase [Legionella sp. PC1000]
MRKCWCGTTKNLSKFGPNYGFCLDCQTLVSQAGLNDEELLVKDDETDFYGKKYWIEHQTHDLEQADIFTRSRTDLIERNLHWMQTLLKYQSPPAKVLEIGCCHGSFVALMKQAGYMACGLELSPWVIEYGQHIFDVPILLGPVEQAKLEPASFDVIALMDVLEHLPDPEKTMRLCLQLLKPGGCLIIQTPQFKENDVYENLKAARAPFLQLLTHDEHLYLFSQTSIKRLFSKLGANHIAFEPAIFAHYDMFLIVSRQPLNPHSQDEIEKSLLATASGRMTLALLDLRSNFLKCQNSLTEVEADRAERGKHIQLLSTWLTDARQEVEELQEYKTNAEAQIHSLTTWLTDARQEVEVLQEYKTNADAQIHSLTTWLTDARQEVEVLQEYKTNADAQIHSLTTWLTDARQEVGVLQEYKTNADAQVQSLTIWLTEARQEVEVLQEYKTHADAQIQSLTVQLTDAQNLLSLPLIKIALKTLNTWNNLFTKVQFFKRIKNEARK